MTDTTTTNTAPQRDPDHDMHAAEIYRAIALRFHARYMDARISAAHRGGDLPDAEPLLTQAKTSERYQDVASGCVIESADSAGAALALVEFAAVIAADRLTTEVLRAAGCPSPVGEEMDAFHQVMALANAAAWLNHPATAEWLDRRRAAYGPGGMPKPGDAA
jgi:hypothetical protein